MKRIRIIAILVAVVVVAAASLALLYLSSRPPDLSIKEGSVLGMIEGNLTAIASDHPLVQNFSAITFANQSGGPSSTVALYVQTLAYYVVPPNSQGYLDVEIEVRVTGHVASNLHLTSVRLTVNETATPGSTINSKPANQTGTNVTFDTNQDFGIIGTGSGEATATPTCAGTGDSCDVAYGAAMWADEYLGPTGPHIGLQGTITVSGIPISVGILLAIVNIGGGSSA